MVAAVAAEAEAAAEAAEELRPKHREPRHAALEAIRRPTTEGMLGGIKYDKIGYRL